MLNLGHYYAGQELLSEDFGHAVVLPLLRRSYREALWIYKRIWGAVCVYLGNHVSRKFLTGGYTLLAARFRWSLPSVAPFFYARLGIKSEIVGRLI